MLLNRREQQKKERKKICLLLTMKFLFDNDYTNSLIALEKEIHQSLENYQLSDNIDITQLVHDFEEYYEFKYDRKPVFYKIQSQNPNSKNNKKRKRKSKNNLPLINKKHSNLQDQKENLQLNCNGTKISSQLNDQLNFKQQLQIQKKFQLPNSLMKDNDLAQLAQQLKRDVITESDSTTFDQIIGLKTAKQIIKEALTFPLKFPKLFSNLPIEPWRGILLFGSPGTGKTMLARAVANEMNIIFFNLSISSILSKYHGESEKCIRVLFELARYNQPSIIFIDEVDAIMSHRNVTKEHEASRRLKSELLIQMDRLNQRDVQVFVMAATNCPWDIDHAFLRRVEKRVYVPLPDGNQKKQMLKKILDQYLSQEIDLDQLTTAMDVSQQGVFWSRYKNINKTDIYEQNAKMVIKQKWFKIRY